MKFYNRYYAGSYEELLTYYPRFYRNVFEMVEILKAFGKIVDGLEAGVERVFLNSFILTADIETVKEWERVLGITYETNISLRQRKYVIISKLKLSNHVGELEIREVVTSFFPNSKITLTLQDGMLMLCISQQHQEISSYVDCYLALTNTIPAHIGLNMKVISMLQGLHNLYIGTAVRIGKRGTTGMEAVDVSAITMLSDESGNILLDEVGNVLLDE